MECPSLTFTRCCSSFFCQVGDTLERQWNLATTEHDRAPNNNVRHRGESKNDTLAQYLNMNTNTQGQRDTLRKIERRTLGGGGQRKLSTFRATWFEVVEQPQSPPGLP